VARLATTLSSFVIFLEVVERSFSGDGLYAAHTGGHAAFFQNFNQADFSGRVGVCAAAEFGRKIADLDDPDPVAVFLSEQGHGFVLIDGNIDGHVLNDFDLLVAQNFFVDEVFDVLQFFVSNAGEVRKIKAQMVGSN